MLIAAAWCDSCLTAPVCWLQEKKERRDATRRAKTAWQRNGDDGLDPHARMVAAHRAALVMGGGDAVPQPEEAVEVGGGGEPAADEQRGGTGRGGGKVRLSVSLPPGGEKKKSRGKKAGGGGRAVVLVVGRDVQPDALVLLAKVSDSISTAC